MHEKKILYGCQAASIAGMIAALFIPKILGRVLTFGTCTWIHIYCSYVLRKQQQTWQQQQIQDYAGMMTATRELYEELWEEIIARLNGQHQTNHLNHEEHSFQQ